MHKYLAICIHNYTYFYALICLGWALAAISYGIVITQIPGGWLAAIYGGKMVLGFGIAAISVFSLFIPLAAKTSVWFLVALRAAQGLAEVYSRVIETK